MIAFISDLHSNLEALETTLRDIDAQGVDSIVCLGDVIGYGASPYEVCRLVQERCETCLQGNHDAAVLDDQDALGFNERALRAIDWTRHSLDPEQERNWPIWDWLGSLVPMMEWSPQGSEPVLLVHASPCEPLTEYLMPTLAPDSDRVLANFVATSHRLTFYGHTHHPGWFEEGKAFQRAVGPDVVLEFQQDKRYLVNVGSVGQPRNGDARLCYALFDGSTLRWRRLDYDYHKAATRIQQAGLPETLAARLLVGR